MSIEASLRRPQNPAKDRGDVVPDSKPKKAATPQLIMEAGAVRPSYKFEGGGGLIDSFGNVYEGYANSGGSSSVNIGTTESDSLSDVLNNVLDGDFLQYDLLTKKYLPGDYDESNLGKAITTDFINIRIENPENKNYKFWNNVSYAITITNFIFEFEVGSGTVALTQPGTVGTNGDNELIVSGLSAGAVGLLVTIEFIYDQNEAAP